MYRFGEKIVKFQRFCDTFPDLATYILKIKENLHDDQQFTDEQIELSYYLLHRYWLSPYAYGDEDMFVMDHAQDVMIHLPTLINKLDAMHNINESTNFNLTNDEITSGNRNTLQEAENDRLHKFNNTPKLGQNVDLISDTFLTSSDRDKLNSSGEIDETINQTVTRTDTPYKQLLEKLKVVDYRFIENYINAFKNEFMQTTIGSVFYQ